MEVRVFERVERREALMRVVEEQLAEQVDSGWRGAYEECAHVLLGLEGQVDVVIEQLVVLRTRSGLGYGQLGVLLVRTRSAHERTGQSSSVGEPSARKMVSSWPKSDSPAM